MKNIDPITFAPFVRKNGKAVQAGNPNGKLFWVNASKQNHHSVSCYLFADSPDDAIERVKKALTESAKRSRRFDAQSVNSWLPGSTWLAEECPIGIILQAGQCWANNSGFKL